MSAGSNSDTLRMVHESVRCCLRGKLKLNGSDSKKLGPKIRSVVYFSSDGQNMFPPSKLTALFGTGLPTGIMRVQRVQKLGRVCSQSDGYL